MSKGFTTIVQCATPYEFAALRAAFQSPPESKLGRRRYCDVGADLVLLRGGLGKKEASASARFAIERWNPGLLVDFGAAGGLVEGLRAGDLVIAAKVVEHEGDKDYPARAAQSIATFPKFSKLESVDLRATVGSLASDECNIETVEERRRLAAKTKALATTWETAALARVCDEAGVGFASVRLITDCGGPDLLEEYKRGLASYLDTAALALIEIIKDLKQK